MRLPTNGPGAQRYMVGTVRAFAYRGTLSNLAQETAGMCTVGKQTAAIPGEQPSSLLRPVKEAVRAESARFGPERKISEFSVERLLVGKAFYELVLPTTGASGQRYMVGTVRAFAYRGTLSNLAQETAGMCTVGKQTAAIPGEQFSSLP